ncbi:MAG: chorismate mutase [Sphingomonadaceae bacterium]|jgi:isochorismate pyruvate lyase|uniref:chorismate mutase n=1 Tax=Sphingorhabdus sp. TaxID=1902408 RepID=UPI002FDA1EBE|nr:chorismate mutase [Sphingomonadaceae bacterium]
MNRTVSPIEPIKCNDMTQVRAGVDWVDAQLVELLALRFGYMDAAARIKAQRAAVRDEARKQQVLAHVQNAAREAGIPVEVVADLWERLVEASIAYELEKWDALRA